MGGRRWWSLSAASIRDGGAQGTSVRKFPIRTCRVHGTGERSATVIKNSLPPWLMQAQTVRVCTEAC
eukprot:7675997-Pyramimonas_sp.AAC.1